MSTKSKISAILTPKWNYARCLMLVAGCLISTSAYASYCENSFYDCPQPFCCPNTYYVEADYLYWKASVDDMPFAWGRFIFGTGRTKDIDYRFSSGFRLGAGTVIGCSDWDLSLTYTWYKNHSTGFFFDPLVNSIPTFSNFLVGIATGDRTLRFQTLDLSIKKDFCLCNDFHITPHFGLLAANIRDHYLMTGTDTAQQLFLGYSDNFQKLCAIGPKIGINAAVNLFCSVSFIIETSLSLLWSDYEIRRTDVLDVTVGSNFDTIQRFDSLRFVPQYLFGFQWDTTICCDKYHLRFLAAWEEQKWINYNQMIFGDLADSRLPLHRNSDLNLYGLTLRSQLLF